jgi:FMN phosphatase YigB (HAD superfamily)
LLDAARHVHVQHHTTECRTLLAHLAGAADWPSAANQSTVRSEAALAYRRYWDEHLQLYPGVATALRTLAERGCRIAAYTENDAHVAAARLAQLGLGGVIDRVYGRVTSMPFTEASWLLAQTPEVCPIDVRGIPREWNKPRPEGLQSIFDDYRVPAAHGCYAGDNLWKDVAMARRAGTHACWARYGTVRTAADQALLARVAHWRPQDVAVERAASQETIHPDVTLDRAIDLCDAVLSPALSS